MFLEPMIRRLDGLELAGITTFPALLFDDSKQAVLPTNNLSTLERAAAMLRQAGLDRIEINAPGTNSTVLLKALAEAGATQVEPGHALTGTTPLHAVRDLPELPAVLHVSEVSHFHGGRAYFFGGGLYIDPIFPDYPVQAVVGRDGSALAKRVRALIPPPHMIDYYGQLDAADHPQIKVGDSVVLGFRPQIFFTRALVAAVAGIARGSAVIKGIWSGDGRQADGTRL